LLIPPDHHVPNLASRILVRCERRLAHDWRQRFGPALLLETFVDPRYFRGTKWVFVRPLVAQVPTHLTRPVLDPRYRHRAPNTSRRMDWLGTW
jgi:hypothetical protein